MEDQKREDLEEADRLKTLADGMEDGDIKTMMLKDADELRSKWTASPEMLALAHVSVSARETDLIEADKLEKMASSLRAGSSSRNALEKEASALRAKWPASADAAEGQVQRIGSYLMSKGLMPTADTVPARAILARIAELE